MREMMLRESRLELERKVRRASFLRERELPAAPPPQSVLLRLSCVRDDEALARLAALEGRAAPKGQHVVAEVAGVVVAALPLGTGPTLADPFRPTAQLVPLLELRAKQLADDRHRRPSRALLRAVRGLSRA